MAVLAPFVAVLGQTNGQTTGQTRGQTDAPPERRIALVIGNDQYENIAKLGNAEKDARAVASELKTRGFDVMEGYNLGRRDMLQLVNRFAKSIAQYQVATFYFSGHGVQLHGKNYIIPIGAKVENEDDLSDDAVPVATIAERMLSTNRQAFDLLIIDACRDNPFLHRGRAAATLRGLSSPEANGVMILQAAGADQEALDSLGPDDKDPNGVFTRELLKAVREPGLPIREMMIKLREAVRRDAASIGREQIPALYDEASGDFIFTPRPPPPPPDPSKAAFEAVASTLEPADLVPFLKAYPTSPYREQAMGRLIALLGGMTKPAEPAKPEQSVAPGNVNPPLAASVEPVAKPQEASLGPEDIKRMQDQLHLLGHYDGAADGQFGPNSRLAVKQFQAFQGDPETGLLTAAEQDALASQSAALAAVLDVPDHSPQGIAASAIPAAEDRRRKAWKLETGDGGQAVDFVEASYWYALASAQGSRVALLALGNLKVRGKGLAAPDPVAARLLWYAAAARGEPGAVYNIAKSAELGVGATADVKIAIRWYHRAADLHFAEATTALRRLEP